MSTNANSNPSKRYRQGNQDMGGTTDLQLTADLQLRIDEECRRIAIEVANIPGLVREYLSSGGEGNQNSNAGHQIVDQGQLQQARLDAQDKDLTISRLETELDKSRMEIQNLRAKEQSLRDIIQKNHHYQDISHEQVINAFAKVRQGIQKLASSKLYQVGAKALVCEDGAFAPREDIAGLWQTSPRGIRLLILRSLLFGILDNQVFSYEGFGIVEEPGANGDKDPHTLASLDEGLSQCERVLVDRNVPDDVVTGWRLSTFRTLEAAKLTGGALGAPLAAQMHDRFASLIKDGATEQEITRLRNAFRELCNEAYSLQLLMRKSKTNYQCVSIKAGVPYSQVEDMADDFGEINGGPAGRVKVALTLFGVLAIGSQSREGKLRVLERAQVVLTRS